MRIASSLINFYLLPTLLALLGLGCQTSSENNPAKQMSTLRLHLEVNSDASGGSAPVLIFRQQPIAVNVQLDSFLDEAHVVQAGVVPDRGGFAIRIQFDHIGTSLLNATTLANPGRRIAVASQFPGMRWLAAPELQGRIADGVFTFTPDATREEAERIVRGLNNAVGLAKKRSLVY